MGCVYRPKGRAIWMVKWRDLSGKLHVESSKSEKKEVAKRILRDKEHLTDQGVLVTPDVGKLKLGEAVKLPACPNRGLFDFTEITETCQRPQNVLDSDAASALVNEVTGQQVMVKYEIAVELPRARCPDWFDIDCLFYGHLVNGRLVSVFVHPRGLDRQEQVAAALKQKYKGCVLNGWYEFKNDVTGDQVWGMDLTCRQTGINVTYKGYTGGGNPGNGGLLIETDAMSRQRNAAEKARVEKKQAL